MRRGTPLVYWNCFLGTFRSQLWVMFIGPTITSISQYQPSATFSWSLVITAAFPGNVVTVRYGAMGLVAASRGKMLVALRRDGTEVVRPGLRQTLMACAAVKAAAKATTSSGTLQAMIVIRPPKLKCSAPLRTGIGTSRVTHASIHLPLACVAEGLIGVTILPQDAIHQGWEYSRASATGATLSSANVFRTTETMIRITACALDVTGVAGRRLSLM